MKRREAIKHSVIFLGAVSLTSGSLLQSCKPSLDDDWEPIFLDLEQTALLDEIAETFLPKTNTPGAKDAKVVRYLDEYAFNFLKPDEQIKFKEGLSLFDSISNQLNQKSFVNASVDQRAAVLQYMYDDTAEGDLAPREVFIQLRNAVNRGFFTSEVGATQVLDYIPIPGNYDGDIALSTTKGLNYSG